MIDKTLVVVVTRNNALMIENLCNSIKKFKTGYECDFLILDSSSDNAQHLAALDKLSKDFRIETVVNNRVEANYNIAWSKNKDYRYYFFMHDDSCINKDNWMKVFVDRCNSGYYEDDIKNTHLKNYPIGKVCLGNQFWRDYTSVRGFPVGCLFLRHALDIIRPNKVPEIFKYCDGDRVFVTNQCMEDTQGFRHIGDFKQMESQNKELFDRLCSVLHKYLPYYDEGTQPKHLYPPGECWSKLGLTAEFLGSVDPLICGWRTVGLYDDGYLEQLHGFDIPAQHQYITHYGSPNFCSFISKKMGVNFSREQIRQLQKSKPFLIKCDKLYKEYNEKNKLI